MSHVYPVVAEFGGVSVGTHAFFVGVGVLLATVVVGWEARRRAFATLLGLRRRVTRPGALFTGYLAMYAAFRERSL